MPIELLIILAIVIFFFLKSPKSKKRSDVNFSRNKWKPVANTPRNKKKPVYGAPLAKQEKNQQEVRVEHVIDGDTVIISKSFRKIRIRLDSIDCPEDGQQWGDIAKFGLIKLIGGREIRLKEHGLDPSNVSLTFNALRNKRCGG